MKMIIKLSFVVIISVVSLSTASVARDKIIIEESQYQPIVPHADEVLGTSRVHLDGNCGSGECNLGNFIADSFVDWNAQRFESETAWTDAAIAIIQAGAVRTSFGKKADGLTKVDVESCLSGEKVVVVEVTGAVLKEALEHGVGRYEKNKSFNEFLQFSGMNVKFNVSRASGDRVIDVEVLCAACIVPALEKLVANANYSILMQEQLAKGSNGNIIFQNKTVRTIETLDTEMFIEYLKKKSPIYPAVEWRITVYGGASAAAISLILLVSSALLAFIARL